ncbi:hypothetical protein M413DRAFT_187569 [Hebeloma cylindrosporum]|uniref:Crinkler effector protein N-terminal domain-containing protein n=1 Tax=Hebeloma cylindrosporum TaxID=76867 RepID=A0A0C3C6S5_HEBCY|nr:hypothetical protein M413DRAFT_187569 [Hebeloma cylindrosporum h7]
MISKWSKNCTLSGKNDELELYGWILNVSATPFIAVVKRGGTVMHLQSAIKKAKENSLHGIDADQLKVWKVDTFSPVLRRRSDVLEVIPAHSFY